jgi:hypothetical protein
MRNLSSVFTLVSMLLPLTIMPVQAHEYVNLNDGYKACMYATLTNRFNDTEWRKASRETKTFLKAAAHKNCK